jgi:predicted DNA-binding protein
MSSKNLRITIALGDETAQLLSCLAKQECKSVSSVAKELILEALERREDMILSAIAHARDTQTSKRLRHGDVWKNTLC